MPYRFSYGALPSELEELSILLEDDLLLGTSNISSDTLKKITLSTLIEFLKNNLELEESYPVPVYNEILKKNPIVLWDFSSFPQVRDLSVLRNDLILSETNQFGLSVAPLVNGTDSARAISNTYYSFSPISALRNLTDIFTFEIVLNIQSYSNGSRGLLSQDTLLSSYKYLFYISGMFENKNYFVFQQKKANNQSNFISSGMTDPTKSLLLNKAHHCVVTKESAVAKVYLDGQLVSQVTNFFIEIPSYTSYTNSSVLTMFNNKTNERFNNGSIAYIAIYNKALTASEVANHHQLALGV